MYNRNLFTVSYFVIGVHRSLHSSRRIRLPFDKLSAGVSCTPTVE